MRNRSHKNFIGTRSGRLLVIAEAPRSSSGRIMWLCKCDCGREIIIRSDSVGVYQSCGCIRNEKNIKRFQTHGYSRTKLYKVHTRLLQATKNPKYWSFSRYGGRGINVCEAWQDFITFRTWALSHGYQEGYHLHRKDVNGNYCPKNCVWLSPREHEKIHGNLQKKPIAKLDDDGNILEIFGCQQEIKDKYGYDLGGIRRAMRTGMRSSGFHWKHI